MRRLTRLLTAFFVGSLLLLTGCDSLNLEPKDELGADRVFEDPALAQSYLNEIYARTGLGYGDPMQTPGIVDEAYNTHGHPGTQNIQSTLTPGDRGMWDAPGWRPADNPPYQGYNWNSVYSSVRDLNLFIQNMQGNETMPDEQRSQLLGEAYFLKGFFYHNLMKLYGGVPLIDRVYELSGGVAQYQAERGTFTETIDYIVADLDSAANLLDMSPRRQGAATEGAAMALKSRVLLYSASDLYNDSPFGSNEYVSHTGGDQQTRWENARDAAQAVIDLGAYSLEPTPTPEAYHELFTKGNPSGTIWARYFNENASFNHNQSQFTSPNGYFSWSGDTPTQQHVDAYDMADGSDFQWEGADPTPSNPDAREPARDSVDADNPYVDRDPRLYANIQFTGNDWRARPSGTPASTDPVGVIMTGKYEMPDGTMEFGLDTPNGPQPWNSSRTGYNLRKFVDRDVAPHQEQAYNPWVFIRYAEVLLNYAEAQANLGNVQSSGSNASMSAMQALNMVRTRVGMPPITAADFSSTAEFMAHLRNEREVELAFEGHRYFDVRRWKRGPETYVDAHGIEATGHLQGDPGQYSGMTLGELVAADDAYNYYFKVINIQEREWADKNYFLPFPNEEMNRNTNLVQNPGY
jgi:hypothetical protein